MAREVPQSCSWDWPPPATNPGLYRRLVPGGRQKAGAAGDSVDTRQWVGHRRVVGGAKQTGRRGRRADAGACAENGRALGGGAGVPLLPFHSPLPPSPPICTCLVDLDDAAVCDLLNEAEQRRLIVAQAGVLVVGADVVDADGPSRDGGTYQALSEALGAPKAQHGGELEWRRRGWTRRAALAVL